jgi:hypothetical protein
MSDLQQFLDFLETRMATHEGGAGAISISWDDATRDWIISQRNLSKKFNNQETLGCSRYLKRAIELAVTGKIYDEE